MAVTHSTTVVGVDDPDYDVSKDEWNASHAVGDGSFVAAKLSATATDKVFGRSTAGAGNGEEITLTAAGRALIDDANAAAQLVTLGAAAASHVHAGADITSGTVADARIDAAIARDSEITATKLDDFATPDDNTDLNATTGRHGLLPKLGGGTTNFLRADGTWNAPAGGGGTMAAASYTNSSTGDYTTTSTTFVDVDATNLALAVTTGARRVLIGLTGTCLQSAAGNTIFFDIDIDGTRVSGGTAGLWQHNVNANNFGVGFTFLSVALSAGSHTIKLQWRVDATTGTLRRSSGRAVHFFVVEQNT